jgi:hypothetical protein
MRNGNSARHYRNVNWHANESPALEVPLYLTSVNRYLKSIEFNYMNKLSILEQRIRQRIEQTKSQIHESHNRAYIDSVLIEIDTLNWVLNEIDSFELEATS